MQTKTLSAMADNLHRLEDRLWSFELNRKHIRSTNPINYALAKLSDKKEVLEIRVHADNYAIATIACNIIKEIGSQEIEKLSKPVVFDLGNEGIYNGCWKITVIKDNPSWLQAYKQSIPFIKMINESQVIDINIEPLKSCRFLSWNKQELDKRNISEYFKAIINDHSFPPITVYYTSHPSIEYILEQTPFEDPFTQIATDAFQRWESKFIHQNSINSDYRIVLKNDYLILKPNNKEQFNLEDVQINRKTVEAFKNFAIKCYGAEKLKYIQHEYGFNFDEMIINDVALTPEIVYRVNVGVNNIEMQDIEKLYHKLLVLNKKLSLRSPKDPLELVFQNELLYRGSKHLTQYEASILYQICPEKNVENLRNIIQLIVGKHAPNRASLLSPTKFKNLVALLMPSMKQLKKAYTGREIQHKAIMGYYTLADKTYFKPWLDQQELLQIFKSMQKATSWNSYFELLSHVAVKKHLIHRHPIDKWRVGSLLPSPSIPDANWYRIDSCIDDNEGDFNYTLIPACKNNLKLPAIKLYRSTASDSYAMNGWDSVAADLKLANAPAAGNRSAADIYENPFFYNRTIPIWVGYYLLASQKMWQKIESPSQYLDIFHTCVQAINEYNIAYPRDPIDIPVLDEGNIEELKATVTSLAEQLEESAIKNRELPRFKIAQDIAFVGHSLGGSLAQGGMYHFGPEAKRIPLQGCNFICYASDPPGITKEENDAFFAFGLEHKELLKAFGQKWKITIQMEYGDFVPQSGEVHLGATDREASTYQDWLDIDISVFKPCDQAIAKEITTAPTHGRRIGCAKKGVDYTLSKLTPQMLLNFDRSWWLNSEQQSIFGYKIVNSPKISELFRRVVAGIRIPLGQTAKLAWQALFPPRGNEIRDENGYLHVPYNSPAHN